MCQLPWRVRLGGFGIVRLAEWNFFVFPAAGFGVCLSADIEVFVVELTRKGHLK